ncbi:MAG: ATP citrate lyase citrate-binding domain-containing protein [archaeon]|nr:ATP citrate lyase citrate-binding domain-containing protein [archaeon]
MKLKEFEAKKLIRAVEIPTSNGFLITSSDQILPFTEEIVFKVQTIANGRGKAGGILTVKTAEEAKSLAAKFLGKKFLNETITEIVLDEKVPIDKEIYLGITFDTSKRSPVLIIGPGGVDAENLPKQIQVINFDSEWDISTLPPEFISSYLPNNQVQTEFQEIVKKLKNCFVRFDCKMIEINPLVLTLNNNLVAVDAVAVLDDDASFRREISFPPRTNNREATAREIAAREIDKDDYRGVAGKTFIDLDGDIGILTSGGGASMTLMDALLKYGGKPANFTEYSGNPPQEKVEKLTRIVLDKENLSGLLVAGVIANFTNIAETLKGVLIVIEEKKPKFPIVIRRAGPHDDEAKKMIEEIRDRLGLSIHYFDENTPLTKSVEIIIQLSNRYKEQIAEKL